MNRNIILGVSGSIAAYKSADIVSKLNKNNISSSVVMTESAQKFITPMTLQILSGKYVYTDIFTESESEVSHIDVVNKSDMILIAPATANVIAKLAHGICDDMLTTMCMVANGKKIVVAPAMNTNMYENPITQRNIQILKDYGFIIIEPREALLACGDYGKGALATIDEIANIVIKELQ